MVSSGIVEHVSPVDVLKNNKIGCGIELNPEIQSMISQKTIYLRLRGKHVNSIIISYN